MNEIKTVCISLKFIFLDFLFIHLSEKEEGEPDVIYIETTNAIFFFLLLYFGHRNLQYILFSSLNIY
jgi:hypothetical protein